MTADLASQLQESMDRLAKGERLVEIYMRLGAALWGLQGLELTAAQYVVVRLRKTRGVGLEKGEAIAATVEDKAFGRSLRELTDASVFDEELADKLEAMRKDRNWLAYKSNRENRGVLQDPAMCERLCGRLDDIASRALMLNKRVGEEMEKYVVAAGVSRGDIETEAARLLEAWGLSVDSRDDQSTEEE